MNRIIALLLAGFAPLMMAEAAAAEEKVRNKKDYDLDTGEFEILFGDGEKLTFNVDELPDEMKRQLMFHGVGQKVGDSYASTKQDFAKARILAQGVVDQLKNGEWAGGRGEGEARPRLGELAEAISRIKNMPLDEVKALVERAAALDGDEAAKKAGAKKLAEWRAHKKIKAEILQLRLEKAQKELETSTAGEEEVVL